MTEIIKPRKLDCLASKQQFTFLSTIWQEAKVERLNPTVPFVLLLGMRKNWNVAFLNLYIAGPNGANVLHDMGLICFYRWTIYVQLYEFNRCPKIVASLLTNTAANS